MSPDTWINLGIGLAGVVVGLVGARFLPRYAPRKKADYDRAAEEAKK